MSIQSVLLGIVGYFARFAVFLLSCLTVLHTVCDTHRAEREHEGVKHEVQVGGCKCLHVISVWCTCV